MKKALKLLVALLIHLAQFGAFVYLSYLVYLKTGVYFIRHLVPYPSMPYALALAVVCFCALNTASIIIQRTLRRIIHAVHARVA